MKDIGYRAFQNCSQLSEFYCYAELPPVCSIQALEEINKWKCTLFVPYGALESYQEANQWKDFFCIEEMVPILANEIYLNFDSIELNLGDTVQLEATVLPENTTDKSVTWNSSDHNVATVSNYGLVTAISHGTTIITASCGDVSATCEITIINPIIDAEQVILNYERIEIILGDSFQLEATVLPENTTDKTVTWQSSNNAIAAVNDSGLVTAISEGSATITVTNGKISTSCQITVLTPIVDTEKIVLNFEVAELNIGETVQLEATVLPEDATDQTIYWNSSDDNITTVSETGLVRAVRAGIATITATCDEVFAECKITVIDDAGVESLLANPDSKISIYTTEGVLIKKDCKVEDLKTLNKGIYIIVSGNERYKISI